MMTLIRALLVGGGVFLGVQWYQNGDSPEGPQVPSNVQLIEGVELFPPSPTNALASVLGPLELILKGQPGDALLMARAFRDFASLSARTPGAVNLAEYSQDYKNALKILLMNTELQGKYNGQVDMVVDKAFQEAMKPYADANGEYSNQEITQQVRASIVDWLLSVSGKCHEVYLKNLEEVK